MANVIKQIDDYHQTKKGKIVFGVIEILAAYAIISRAIDTGSLWQYAVAAVLIIGGVNNLINAGKGKLKLHGKTRLKKR